MVSRLFCEHCNKYYKVDLDNVNLVKKHNSHKMRFANNTYYYTNGCFFKDLTNLKEVHAKEGE
ncbi:MAG: hypothetical protein JXQ67_07405 [Campylobacterales bacterium]|nr:hypothetical protein [Campylobacterales bacterium]